ncbi:hypothetical protein KGQ19_00295 [Catenulispora sp. NL8]|uniref:Secreted protein n=1 Tax=Catenulispora pinistramenti TaxID=2705254 RepID=A0ABS5KGC1_9ACTN|nr:hypothetical protein [Catenulispora pinistramenti]MBS2545297.1 hypothetical protein [Catenulispora pinistramenti]
MFIAAATLIGVATAPAQAATGSVVVFSTELQPLTVYTNPQGCQQLPTLAHVLDNETSSDIQVFADPFCAIPVTLPIGGNGVLPAGCGTHITGGGSFRA